MQTIRTLIWILITVVLVAFIAMNWGEKVPLNLWPLEASYIYVTWPIGLIAFIFFLLGLVPMWLVYRASRWRLERRITSLEHSVRLTTIPPAPAPASQLDTSGHAPDPLV